MTTRAQTPVERPALEVPPAPPRIVAPAPPQEAAQADPVPELPPERTEPAVTKPRPAAAAQSAARDVQKPEVKPEPPAEDTVVAQPPAVPVLRTPATANTAAAARQIEETLDRAQKTLYSVDYQRLTAPRQKAYNEAKDFITEAETHLKASNLEAAKELADKAEKYATLLLQGR
jgi:hypothetical protein